MKNILVAFFAGCLSYSSLFSQNGDNIHPGKLWNDLEGNPINAHGGGILFYKGNYFWFGEIKKGATWRVPGITSWEDYRVKAGGVSCYQSADLVHWKYISVALKPVGDDSLSDLHTSKIIERPKVIYNDRTGKFVMWMHIDKEDYGYARAGVAISDKPEGPYTFLGSVRPNGQMSRDMTLFKDDDGKAYLIYASEENQTMQVCLLSDDYLKPGQQYTRILIGANREAPAIVKYLKKYYLVTSLCTGWDPNKALYAIADEPMGDWKMQGNPCTGTDADSTYHAQSTFILPVEGADNHFIFMADRWNKTDLENSRYIWLPMHFEKNMPVIDWKDAWSPMILPR